MSESNVLRFCTGKSDNRLFLGTPGNCTRAKKESETRNRMTIKLRCPISIRISRSVNFVTTKSEMKVFGPFEVANDTFDSNEMGNGR